STQRPLQVFEQILGRLDADRKTQQSVADPEARPLLGRESRMRSRRRPGEERMHATEARSHDREAHPGGKFIGATRRPLELEAQDAAEACEQAPGAGMSRMRLEPRVVHALDRPVAFEEARDPQRALVLVAHPERERLESPAQQERGVGVERAAEMLALWRMRSISSAPPETTPATMSAWPLRYFVALWIDRSKPASMGR